MDSRIPITRTKIMVPRRRADLLSRQRLLDLMIELLDLKLTILAAPAGYGKTSLLIDLVDYAKLPVCWVSLDAHDQDPQSFIAHLIASINTRFRRFGKESMGALENSSQDSLNLDMLVTLITNDAYEHISEHFAIVIDDYHLVEESKAVTYFINQLIQKIDENCHIIISSRTLLNLPDMPLLVARSQVGGLSFEELAFQPEEIKTLWLNNFHLTLSTSDAASLAADTEGWITGLLLNRQTSGGLTERMSGARVAGVGLYEYLAQQVLERQAPEIQHFLLQTSLLEEFDAELCAEVLEPALGQPKNWQSLIDDVLRANLFILPIGDERIFLRYHHLFRDFLLGCMLRDYPDESARIQTTLAEVWARHGEWERSYEVYKRIGQIKATADLIEQAGSSLIARGRTITLSNWLNALPDELLTSRPALISLQGVTAFNNGSTQEGLNLLTHAIHAYETSGNPVDLAQSLVRRATSYRLMGDYQNCMADATRTLQMSETTAIPLTIQIDALQVVSIGYYYQGQLLEALNWLDKAQKAAQIEGDAETIAKIAMFIGMTSKALGRYPEAEKAYQRALEYHQSSGNIFWQANLLNNLGVLQQIQGNYESAAASFEKAVHYGRLGGNTRLEGYALVSIGDLYRDLDAFDESALAYSQARPIALRINDRFLIFYLDLAEAILARVMGKPDKSRRLLVSAWHAAEQSGSRYQINLCRLERGAQHLMRNETQDAQKELTPALEYFEQAGHRIESLRAYFYLTTVDTLNNDRDAALSHLNRIYATFADPGSESLLAAVGHELKDHLATLRNDPDFERAVTAILQQVEHLERRIPGLRRMLRRQVQTVPLGPPKLIIHTLGRVQVRVNSKVVTSADWQTQTSRDLFLLILAHPEGLDKEVIGEILWPGSSPAELKMRFKNSIYRLRRATGKDTILFEDDIYRFNRELDYEEDAETFLREFDQANGTSDPDQKIYHYHAALKTHKGTYLPDVEHEWVLPRRQQIQQAYVELLLRLANLELENHQYEAALQSVQRLLNEDPCLEEAYRLGMLIHAAMGNRAGIVRQYEQCSTALLIEFKAQPSQQTRELYTLLIH